MLRAMTSATFQLKKIIRIKCLKPMPSRRLRPATSSPKHPLLIPPQKRALKQTGVPL